jgi:predicted KAP-like P-loop ATPase
MQIGGTMTDETNLMHQLTDEPYELKVNDHISVMVEKERLVIHKHPLSSKRVKITISE